MTVERGQQEYEGVCAELRSQNSPPSSTELLLLAVTLDKLTKPPQASHSTSIKWG